MVCLDFFLEDKTNDIADHFVFKHHYITSALDCEVLCTILKAIHEKRNITVEMINRKKDRITETKVVPLQVMISVQNGVSTWSRRATASLPMQSS